MFVLELWLRLQRRESDDVREVCTQRQDILGEEVQMQKMPGFKITWHYTEGNISSENFYYKTEDSRSLAFVRKILFQVCS